MKEVSNGQRGAVLTEAALALPLFLALLFGIVDLALTFSDRCAFLAAFHDATRKASIELSTCSSQIEVENLISQQFSDSLHSFLPIQVSALNASIVAVDPSRPELQASIRAPSSCIFCLFFFRVTGSQTEYSSTVTLPLEKRSLCS